KKEIKKNTVLVSVMSANNEIGTIQPIREIAKEIRHWKKINSIKIFFHTDAVQTANYLDLNVEKLGVDLLSLSGSKIDGAGRIGILYKRKTVSLANIFGGGDQEMGLRPGTENLPEIIKFTKALKSAQEIKDQEIKRLTKLRDYFIVKLSRSNLDNKIIFNGDLQNRLPNNVNVSFPKIPSDLLVVELSAKGIMASSKSACKSGESGGSYVIEAIRKAQNLQGKTLQNSEIGGVRFSLGRDTAKKDIDYTVKSLFSILQKLKKWYN
ncbi:MAG: aminotransferase class V-fold PLP-dependent enzyme, partial [Minisyncoccia bacterium]